MSAPSRHQVSTKLALSEHHVCKILEYSNENRSIVDIMALFNRKDRTKFKKTFINPLIEEDFLTMTIPDKPKSSKQGYIITDRGEKLLEYLKKKWEAIRRGRNAGYPAPPAQIRT